MKSLVEEELNHWIELSEDFFNSIFKRNEEKMGFREFLNPYLSKNKTFADLSINDSFPSFKRIINLLRKYYTHFKSRI